MNALNFFTLNLHLVPHQFQRVRERDGIEKKATEELLYNNIVQQKFSVPSSQAYPCGNFQTERFLLSKLKNFLKVFTVATSIAIE